MHHDEAGGHVSGRSQGAQHGIFEKRGAKALAVPIFVDGKTTEDNGGNETGHIPPNRACGFLVEDLPHGQGIEPNDSLGFRLAGDEGAAGP